MSTLSTEVFQIAAVIAQTRIPRDTLILGNLWLARVRKLQEEYGYSDRLPEDEEETLLEKIYFEAERVYPGGEAASDCLLVETGRVAFSPEDLQEID